MSKHDESQRRVNALRVGDEIATPGVRGVVLDMANPVPADDTAYAGVQLLTTVKGNSFHPFRSARFYYDDDRGSWQSGNGQSHMTLAEASFDFDRWVGREQS